MKTWKRTLLIAGSFLLSLFILSACGSEGSGCLPEEAECLNSSTYRVCEETGEWGRPQPCQVGYVCQSDGICVEGGQTGDCTPGESACVGDQIQNCGPDGVWTAPMDCLDPDKVCRAGACRIEGEAICTPGDRECKDESILMTCDSLGETWLESECPAREWCYEGDCIPEGTVICRPGSETRCRDRGTVERCNADGTGWENPVSCGSGERCLGGQCVDESLIVCEPGLEMRCSGQYSIQACNTTGTGWNDPITCPEDFICDDGRCIEADCEPGVDFRCTDRGRIMWCNDDGDGFDNPVDCPPGMVCSPASPDGCAGVWGVCEPNSTACDPTDLQIIKQCNADGTGWLEQTIPCPTGSTGSRCHDGQCRDLCDMAQMADSYIGCEYFPVTLMNHQLDDTFKSGDQSEFAVVVSNTNSTYTAQVTVTHPDGVNRNVSVAPNSELTIRLPFKERLITYKGNNAFHLVSTIPVTVYQFNPITARKGSTYAHTNDASLLLPSHVFGEEHLVLNYRTGLSTGNHYVVGWRNLEFPSFFTIVAADDDTEVTVTARGHLRGGTDLGGGPNIDALAPGQSHTTTLAKGEVLQFVSSPDFANVDNSTCKYVTSSTSAYTEMNYCLGSDISGSEVHSSKPVAVYAGNGCAFVPFYYWACDHLEQQMFPTKTWTTQYIAGKLRTPLQSQPNLYKILALNDGTRITTKPNVNAQESPHHNSPCSRVLNRGESCVIETTQNFIIISNPGHPILVGQFLPGQNYAEATSTTEGDPAFVLIPPVEQFRKDYVFLVPDTYRSSYLTLMATRQDVAVTLNGSPMDTSGFTRVSDADAYVMTRPISAGSHRITADSRLGVMVYGYDEYVSYAYPAGLDLSYVPY